MVACAGCLPYSKPLEAGWARKPRTVACGGPGPRDKFSSPVHCESCKAEIHDGAEFCPKCGVKQVRPVEEPDFLGQIFAGKYRVEALIGEGGMGRVYRASHLSLDKQVVLKVLRRSLLSDERTVARFQREAKAASRLNHPNSISVLDFGQSQGSLFMAMEYVPGKDLHQILATEWPLPEARVVEIMGQVLSALSDAHAAGVIHRDLKPENIMVERRRGNGDFVKVLDFGIAKIQDATGNDGRSLTRAGFVCGTPEYMSPEQARGSPVDPRSDLYSVGVILYQLTSGLLPFEATSPVGFATKHLTEEPTPPSLRRPEATISVELEQLILRVLAKDPRKRPQSAEEFRQELLKTHADPPLPHPAPSAQASLGLVRWIRGRTRWVIALGGLAAVAVGGATLVLLRAHGGGSTERGVRPWEKVVPEASYDLEGATDLIRLGDAAHAKGELEFARSTYAAAFEREPDPILALKLGEVCWHLGRDEEARGWWSRYLRDRPKGKARAYIRRIFPDL